MTDFKSSRPKTKKEIEAETPIIKPEDCPGAVMQWVVKRDEQRDLREANRDKELVSLIEKTIDRLFEKHFKKYITMIFTNRILVIVLAVGLAALYGVVLYHLYS